MLPVLSQSEADLAACFQQDIAGLLDSFSQKDTSSKQSLQQMLSSDQAAFSRASIRVLAAATGSAGARYVLHLLRKHNLLMEALADPRGSRREDAIAAARVIPQIGAPIDADLERVLNAALALPPTVAHAARVCATSRSTRSRFAAAAILSFPKRADELSRFGGALESGLPDRMQQ
jgi:hypothetical protein